VEGVSLHFVFIGSSECPVSNSDEMHVLIQKLKDQIMKSVRDSNYRFTSTGIAIDRTYQKGVKFLKKTGPYNEVVSGGGWVNLGANRYIWGEFSSRAVTPQVIITEISTRITVADNQVAFMDRNERLLYRAISADEILNFYNLISKDPKMLTRMMGK